MKKLIATLTLIAAATASANYVQKEGMGLTVAKHTTIAQPIVNYCYDAETDSLRGEKPVYDVKYVGTSERGGLEYTLTHYAPVVFPRVFLQEVEICRGNSDRNCETIIETTEYALSGTIETVRYNKEGRNRTVIASEQWEVQNCASDDDYEADLPDTIKK